MTDPAPTHPTLTGGNHLIAPTPPPPLQFPLTHLLNCPPWWGPPSCLEYPHQLLIQHLVLLGHKMPYFNFYIFTVFNHLCGLVWLSSRGCSSQPQWSKKDVEHQLTSLWVACWIELALRGNQRRCVTFDTAKVMQHMWQVVWAENNFKGSHVPNMSSTIWRHYYLSRGDILCFLDRPLIWLDFCNLIFSWLC